MGGEVPGRTVALIPAFEPNQSLIGLVSELADMGVEVVVVDDGSSTQAAEIFRTAETSATVLHHRTNQGKGEALRTGMAWILDHCPPETMVVTVDADGQHLPYDVLRVCRLAFASIPQGEEGLVLGVRFDDPGTPARSRVGHDLSRLALQMATGRYLVDTQTGLRAFRATMIPEMMSIPGSRFEYEMNQLYILARRGVPFHQVRITTVYDQPSSSHFRGLVDSLRVARALFHCDPREPRGREPRGRFFCLYVKGWEAIIMSMRKYMMHLLRSEAACQRG